MGDILSQDFFKRPVLQVAEDLLGKYIVREINGKIFELEITEVEAYDGPNDLACHGRFGKTKRTIPMFDEGGQLYIYLIYGIYWMINVVTGEKDYPAAVLIRGAGHCKGPGILSKFLKVNKSLNHKTLGYKCGLWIEDRGPNTKPVIKTPRIGIKYAKEYALKPWRFLLEF
eukprot:NODE_98_length_20568_cov_1.409546.p10 type:complete len:171 gc:universal NODE_98_length_20568_cov_1.409546:15626-15114(-)